MMYGWQYQGTDGGWWIVMMIGMVLFWAILVIGLVALLRHNRPTPPHVSASSTAAAVAILQERFARGELTEEEYTRRLAILKESS